VTEAKKNVVKPLRKRSRRYNFVEFLVFLIPCLQFVQVKLIGVANCSDLLLAAVFLYLLFRKRIRISTPVGRRFIILGSLWLVAQCITDIVRRTAFADYARGWSNIGITLVNFAVLWTLLYERPRRIVLYGWGLAAGSLLAFFISPSEFSVGDPWKFGISYSVTLAVVLLASRRNCRGRLPIALVTVIGIINIYLGSRNTGGACLGAASYLLAIRYLQRKGTGVFRLKTRVVVTIAASIVLGAVTILWAYKYAAGRGILGESALEKYEHQTSGQYGMLLGGRKELMGSLPAIYDSPILGHGSWARDPIYLIEARRALAEMGYDDAWDMTSDALEEGYIPSHSYLLGAWVNAGIVGALFWGWFFVSTVKVLMRVYAPNVALLPLTSFIVFSLLWDILFSPYGMTTRIIVPYYFVTMMTCISLAPNKTAPIATGKVKTRIGKTFPSKPLCEPGA